MSVEQFVPVVGTRLSNRCQLRDGLVERQDLPSCRSFDELARPLEVEVLRSDLLDVQGKSKGLKVLSDDERPTRHIATAGARGLGVADLARIERIEVERNFCAIRNFISIGIRIQRIRSGNIFFQIRGTVSIWIG